MYFCVNLMNTNNTKFNNKKTFRKHCYNIKISIHIMNTRRAVLGPGFFQTLANFSGKMNDFRRMSRCATAKKPFLWGKSAIFSRFSGHFQNSRIPGSQNSGFRILEFWNSGNGRFEGINVRVFSTLPLGKTYS